MKEMGIQPAGDDTDLRDDEAVCAVTNLSYNKHLEHSPHIDSQGRRT